MRGSSQPCMKRLSIWVLLIAGFALIGVILYALYTHFTPRPLAPITTAQAGEFQFEIADTPEKQQKGLGGRSEIPDNYGMLFVFPIADRYSFWMRDMLVPIDIVWLTDDGTIFQIDHSVSPDTYPATITASKPTRYVLETRAGYALDHGWEIGTKIPLPR